VVHTLAEGGVSQANLKEWLCLLAGGLATSSSLGWSSRPGRWDHPHRLECVHRHHDITAMDPRKATLWKQQEARKCLLQGNNGTSGAAGKV
jgi:hypothetical protein